MSRYRFQDVYQSQGSSGMRDSRPRRLSRLQSGQTGIPEPPIPIPEITVRHLFDTNRTVSWFDGRKNRIGNAAGVDGIQLRHLKRADVARLCKDVIGEIHSGEFLPNPLRTVDIPRLDGRTRTLMLSTIAERIVYGAAANYLTAAVAPHIGPNFHGSLPNRGVHTLLAEIVKFVASTPQDSPIYVREMDVVRAFDNVRLSAVTEVLSQMGFQDEVVEMLQRIFTPTDAAGEITGLPQGNPFSPILFAVTLESCFQQNPDLSESSGVLTPLVYVDNIVYITTQERLLSDSIQFHQSAINLKGLDYGPWAPSNSAGNLRTGDTSVLLGNALTVIGTRPRFEIEPGRVQKVQELIRSLAVHPNPLGSTLEFLNAYVSSKGHIYATAGREYCNQTLSTICGGSEVEEHAKTRILDKWRTAGGNQTNTWETQHIWSTTLNERSSPNGSEENLYIPWEAW